MNQQQIKGVWVPALTPFGPDLSVDRDAFVHHCRWLLDQGADGLAVFGTTSEANSLALRERTALLEALIEAGVPPHQLMPGVGCCSVPETVELCRHALEQGCSAVLMLPPFYYKGVSDDGLYAAFASVIERTGPGGLQFFLYHIPPMTQVPISHALIARLLEAFPGTVAGIKDSGGDWEHTRELLERFPDLTVFAGSERFLLDTLRRGGAGCITASGNVNPAGIRVVFERWRDGADDVDSAQACVTSVRGALEQYAMIPALKALCAGYYESRDWAAVRPPLTALAEAKQAALHETMDELEFAMGSNAQSILRKLEAHRGT